MEFRETELPGVILVVPDVHRDARGYFLESYQEEKYRAGGIEARFVQDNQSRSTRGTLRGLHAQIQPAQGKLVRVLMGEIFDVAVDIRRGSTRFGQTSCATLSDENFHQLFVPPGFLHGFCVTSEVAVVAYKTTAVYNPAGEIAVAWNDPEIAIPWPVRAPHLSDRDRNAPRLATLLEGARA